MVLKVLFDAHVVDGESGEFNSEWRDEEANTHDANTDAFEE